MFLGLSILRKFIISSGLAKIFLVFYCAPFRVPYWCWCMLLRLVGLVVSAHGHRQATWEAKGMIEQLQHDFHFLVNPYIPQK